MSPRIKADGIIPGSFLLHECLLNKKTIASSGSPTPSQLSQTLRSSPLFATTSISKLFSPADFRLVPGGSALRAPAPHDTPFTVPCRPDPEEDISAGSHLCHGFCLAASHPPFFNGGRMGSLSSSSPGRSSIPSFRHHRGLHSPPLLLRVIMGVSIPLLSFSSSSWQVFLLLLFRWHYEGHGRIVVLATCL